MTEFLRIAPDAAEQYLATVSPLLRDSKKLQEHESRYYQALQRMQGKAFPHCLQMLGIPRHTVCLAVGAELLAGLASGPAVLVDQKAVIGSYEDTGEAWLPGTAGADPDLEVVRVLTPFIDGYPCRQPRRNPVTEEGQNLLVK